MKKILVAMLGLALFVCMTACGNSRFESQEDMFAHLNGMWVVDDLEQDEYYIFQDGQLHQLDDWVFQNKMDSLMDDILENDGVEALCHLDYETVLESLNAEDILGNPYSGVEINYKKGTIILNKDESNEKHIIVDESSVGIKYAEDEYTTSLKKVSDIVDFTGEHFAELFDKTKANYTISTTQFWTEAKAYGEMVKAFNPEVDGWELTTDTESTTIYESNKWVPSISGSLLITDTLVSYSRKVSLLNSWTSNIDFNPAFTVLYSPGKSVIIHDVDNMSLDMGLLIQYAANAFRNFPGAADHIEVNDLIAKEYADGNYTIEDGAAKVTKTIRGVTYKVMQGTDGMWGYVFATANDTLKISDIAEDVQIESDKTQMEQTEGTSGTTKAEVTEPMQPMPTNETPYTTELSGTLAIYTQPDSNSSYVQSVGQDGTYTIVEEAYDSTGNLWGKLKSGLGWVILEEISVTPEHICPQCGQTWPEAVFTEDWKPGDPCFGCLYSAQGGDSDEKLICKQCGADCSFRGLEEDGRCEDCYYGS